MTVPNGQKLLVGSIESTNYIYIAKLKGTHYEMGKAFGQMFKEELPIQLKAFFAYIKDTVNILLFSLMELLVISYPSLSLDPLLREHLF